MALPILKSTVAFDATADHTFNFTWSGSQSYGSILKIYNNSTNALVYTSTVTSFKLENTVPASSLTNGTVYNAQIASVDSAGTASSYSSKIVFYCYTTPTFSFTSVVDSQTVNSSSLSCDLTYAQTEGELLNSYKVTLYDISKTQLSTSGLLYDTDSPTYKITGLSDNTQYYIRAEGTTLRGMSMDTGYILISVDYVTPSTYATVQLENVPLQGSVQVTCNIKTIDGTSNPETPTYIDSTKVDLTTSGTYVLYDSGFSINGDFSTELLVVNPTVYSTIFECNDGTYNITVKYCVNTFVGETTEQCYFLLTATNAITEYRITSNLMTVLGTSDECYVLIRRVDNLFDITTILKT